jgi:hypothetical protein
MAKDKDEELLDEAEEDEQEQDPESPGLADYSRETAAPAPSSGGVTYVRQPNGKLIPFPA